MRVTTTTTMEGIFEGGTIATRRRFCDWRRRQRQMQRVGRDGRLLRKIGQHRRGGGEPLGGGGGAGGDSKLRRLPGAAVRRGGIAHSPDCWMPMP
jgi:hypothetical protein